MVKGRIRKAWDIYRQVIAFKGLLQLLGFWKWIALGASVVAAYLLYRWNQASTPIRVLVGLITFILGLAATLFLIALARAIRQEQPTQAVSKPAGTYPELIIEYSYEDGLPNYYLNKPGGDPSAPVAIKNISQFSNAYNVRIEPLIIDGKKADFLPYVTSCIPAGSCVQIRAKSSDLGPLQGWQFPSFLRLSYADSSEAELFGEKTFNVILNYEDSESLTYNTVCQIIYTPWKNKVSTGVVTRQIGGKPRS